MNRCLVPVTRTLVVALVTACLTTVSLAQGGPPQGPPGGMGVTVLNAPLPVTQGGPWTVQVVNPSGTPAAVSITNPATNPVPTSNVDNPGRIPYQSTQIADTTCIGTSPSCVVFFPPVPSGHRLVVLHVSGLAGAATKPGQMNIGAGKQVSGVGGVRVNSLTNFAFQPFTVDTTFDQSVLMYLDAGDIPGVDALTEEVNGASSVNMTFLRINLSGYLLDCSVSKCVPIAH